MANIDNVPWEEPEPDKDLLRRVKIAKRYCFKRDTHFIQEQRIEAKLFHEAGKGSVLDYYRDNVYKFKQELKRLNTAGRMRFMRDGERVTLAEVTKSLEVYHDFADIEIEGTKGDPQAFDREARSFFYLCARIKMVEELKEEAAAPVMKKTDGLEDFLTEDGLKHIDKLKTAVKGKGGVNLACVLIAMEDLGYIDVKSHTFTDLFRTLQEHGATGKLRNAGGQYKNVSKAWSYNEKYQTKIEYAKDKLK